MPIAKARSRSGATVGVVVAMACPRRVAVVMRAVVRRVVVPVRSCVVAAPWRRPPRRFSRRAAPASRRSRRGSRAAPKIALPATKVSQPASAAARMLSTLMPPSTSSRMSRPLRVDALGARCSIFRSADGDEALAAEAGVDAHHQHEVDLVDHPVEHVERRRRVEHQPGLAAGGADQLQRAIDVRARVGMKADEVGAGLGERLRERVDRLDHQVDVDRHLRCRRRRRRACAAPRRPSARSSGSGRNGCPSRRSGSSRRRRR